MSMSNKMVGKLTFQGGILFAWSRDDLDTKEALLASFSIWGDEASYIALGGLVRSGALWHVGAPVAAAYTVSELYEDPEPAEEFLEEYHAAVQAAAPPYEGGDILRDAHQFRNLFKSNKHWLALL